MKKGSKHKNTEENTTSNLKLIHRVNLVERAFPCFIRREDTMNTWQDDSKKGGRFHAALSNRTDALCSGTAEDEVSLV